MADPNDLGSEIQDAAAGPRAVRTTSGSVDAQPLGDLIKADRYLAAKEAAKKKRRGLRFTKFVGPAQCPAGGTQDLTDPNLGAF